MLGAVYGRHMRCQNRGVDLETDTPEQVVVREVFFDELRSACASMWVDHYCEVNRMTRALDACRPNWERYKLLDEADALWSWLVEHDGETVGYCVMLWAEHPHCIGQRVLNADSIYVKPESRGTGAFAALMKDVEKAATEMNADCVWSAPAHSVLDRILAGRKNYRASYTTYIKKAGK